LSHYIFVVFASMTGTAERVKRPRERTELPHRFYHG